MKKNIDVIIGHKNSITTKYNEERLSKDFCSYIDHECLNISKNDEIVLNFVTKNNIDESIRQEIIQLIRDHYKEKIKYLCDIIKSNNRKEFILFCIGLVFICASFITTNIHIAIIPEILQIVGWVFIWECIYADIFVKSEEKHKLMKYRKILNSEIIFNINEA